MFNLRDAKESVQRLRSLASVQSAARRARLRDPLFTIVSNDCWGAEVYKDLDLPFSTPLIGTMIAAPCFMRLVSDCSRLITSPMRFTSMSRYPYVQRLRAERWFPTGVLDDDVEVQFLHYASIGDARGKWQRRVERIAHERLFYKLSGDKDLFTDDDLRAFDALPLDHKVAFSRGTYPELPSVVTIPNYIEDGKKMYDITLGHFDVVSWLNGANAADART